jgi:hypothetical protein
VQKRAEQTTRLALDTTAGKTLARQERWHFSPDEFSRSFQSERIFTPLPAFMTQPGIPRRALPTFMPQVSIPRRYCPAPSIRAVFSLL